MNKNLRPAAAAAYEPVQKHKVTPGYLIIEAMVELAIPWNMWRVLMDQTQPFMPGRKLFGGDKGTIRCQLEVINSLVAKRCGCDRTAVTTGMLECRWMIPCDEYYM